jgi:hypothetical protein
MSSNAMWMTLDLLVARECRRSPRDLLDELEEWLESVRTSALTERVRAICDSTTSDGLPEISRKNKKSTHQNVQSGFHQSPCR